MALPVREQWTYQDKQGILGETNVHSEHRFKGVPGKGKMLRSGRNTCYMHDCAKTTVLARSDRGLHGFGFTVCVCAERTQKPRAFKTNGSPRPSEKPESIFKTTVPHSRHVLHTTSPSHMPPYDPAGPVPRNLELIAAWRSPRPSSPALSGGLG